MVNSTAGSMVDQRKGWRNMIVDNQRECSKSIGLNDWQNAKVCSYFDQKRGMKGFTGSGPITLKFTGMFHCMIWIGESDWSKVHGTEFECVACRRTEL